MRYFWASFLSFFITQYILETDCEKAFRTSEQDRRKKRLEGLEDVLTEEEKEILMNL